MIRAAAPYAGLIALNVLFRLPLLLNADGVHSDAAIGGLQAMHLLNGETSRFLWGVTHQGAFDVWVIAAFFLLGGPTPLMLMLAPFFGHLVLSCALFALLRRVLPGRAAAFITCLTLVFTTQAINGIVLYVPRQWSMTVALCGVVLIAWPAARRTPLRLALGTALVLFSIYIDFICTLWLPATGLLVLLVCLESPRESRAVALRFAGAAAGTVIGVALVAALRGVTHPAASDFGASFIARNWPLMRDINLPSLLGARVWIPGANQVLPPDLWNPPAWVAALQWSGAASVIALVLASAALAVSSRVRWEVKRLVLFGVVATVTTLCAFAMSTFPSDVWTTRYLGPVIWSLPFSLAALASAVRPRRLLVLLAPFLAVAAIGGWVGYGSWVQTNRPEVELGEFLRQRGYTHGYAPYWLSYRLTFLWTENPIIAPLNSERYPPYTEAADRAKKKAFIFHVNEPGAMAERNLAYLRRQPGRVEVVTVAGFTVILYDEQ